jgi:hypothetical protein
LAETTDQQAAAMAFRYRAFQVAAGLLRQLKNMMRAAQL